MPRVAVCLSGCGVLDGSEIQEAVFTLLALDQAGAEAVCCAPNIEQADVMDHIARSPVPSVKRNVLTEAARIARGNITDLALVKASDIDALILPGGFGAAKNLCTFAADGPNCRVNPEVQRLITEMLAAGKPIGAICIAPALLARVLGLTGRKGTVTIGNDAGTAGAIEKMGATHADCACASIVVDDQNRIVTTPAYMYKTSPAPVFEGIQKLVNEVVRLAR